MKDPTSYSRAVQHVILLPSKAIDLPSTAIDLPSTAIDLPSTAIDLPSAGYFDAVHSYLPAGRTAE